MDKKKKKGAKKNRIKTATIVRFITAAFGIMLIIVSVLDVVSDMYPNFYIITVIGALILAFSFVSIKSKDDNSYNLDSRYARKASILTASEYNFLQLLRQIEPLKYEIVPQMALVTVIDKVTNTSYRNELFRIADFCVVDRESFAPLLLIELNDSSHERADRKERDAKVNAICKAAGLPLVTFTLKDDYDFEKVRRTVLRSVLKK